METAKHTVILLLLALLTTGATQSAENQAAAFSDTLTASCLVKITCDSAILPLNLQTIDYLLHSSGVDGRARREVLGISPDQDYDLFTIEYMHDLLSDAKMKSPGGGSSGMEGGMDEYEYAMMMEAEMERGKTSKMQPGNYSSTARSRSSSRRTTASRTQPTTGTSYSRSRRGRGEDLYGYTTTSTAPRQRVGTATADPTNVQTDLFSLNVHLPEDIEPLAKEYMKALVVNLRKSLYEAHDAHSNDLRSLLKDAEIRRNSAQSQLAKAIEQTKAIGLVPAIRQNPADAAVNEQLEQIVDLSNLTSSTSFTEVIEILGNSVDPPLQIQPNWKDLLDNGEVEQTTPAGMDPLTGIKLRKALEILLDGISGDLVELKYVLDEGVIVIATQERLPSKLEVRVYEIPALAYAAGGAKDLIDAIQKTIEPDSWYDLGELGEGTITPYPSQLPRKLAVLQTYEIHQKIGEFLQNITIDIPAGTPLEIPVEIHFSEKNSLLREKQNLEMELARLQGRMPAIEVQIKRIKKEIDLKVHTDQVSEELRKILAVQEKSFELTKRLVESGTASTSGLADAEEKLARARIELARRREQIGASAGTDQLAKFSNELAMMAIDIAENKAMLEIVSNQLNRTEQQITASTILDPQVSQIRLAVRALEFTEKRVNELSTLALNVQPPTVSMFGAE